MGWVRRATSIQWLRMPKDSPGVLPSLYLACPLHSHYLATLLASTFAVLIHTTRVPSACLPYLSPISSTGCRASSSSAPLHPRQQQHPLPPPAAISALHRACPSWWLDRPSTASGRQVGVRQTRMESVVLENLKKPTQALRRHALTDIAPLSTRHSVLLISLPVLQLAVYCDCRSHC